MFQDCRMAPDGEIMLERSPREIPSQDKVLLVDDDPNILSGYRRVFKKKMNIETAVGAEQAIIRVKRDGPFSVIVSDLKMPKMDGITLLSRIKAMSPMTVRMMLTGYADINNAMKAINEGNVFRFLLKPCEPQTLFNSIVDGIKLYRLQTAEKELLEKTLSGSIQVLSEILALVQPEAFGRSMRLARLASDIADLMGIEETWAISTAAHLSQIGLLIMPTETLEQVYKEAPLTSEEREIFEMHPLVASDLLKNIPRLETIRPIIAYQEKRFDGSGVPRDDQAGRDIPLGARILKAVNDYDKLTSRGVEPQKALLTMIDRRGWYDPDILDVIARIAKLRENWRSLGVMLGDLKEGMVISESIWLSTGRVLVPAGQQVTELTIERIKNFDHRFGVQQPIYVEREGANAN
jgi:response regulator RpfG family c-di-GMP phosphodiesterase